MYIVKYLQFFCGILFTYNIQKNNSFDQQILMEIMIQSIFHKRFDNLINVSLLWISIKCIKTKNEINILNKLLYEMLLICTSMYE